MLRAAVRLKARRVQIIETSDLGVRAAILRVRRLEGRAEFLLFPMLHAASADFDKGTKTRLRECDPILVEGIDATQARILTLAYRIMVKSKRLGMVAQGDALDLSPFRDRIVHADLNSGEFDRGWRQVPFYLRFLILGGAPLYGVYLYFFGTRALIARYAEFNDLPSRNEVLMYDRDFDQFDHALTGQRDARLIQTIKQLVREPGEQPKTVGILFGAQHMRAVIRYLPERLGYHVADAGWITVIEF
jgi:hypothetical protein